MFLKDSLTFNQQRYVSHTSNLFGYDISKLVRLLSKIVHILYQVSTLLILLVISLLMYYNYKSLLPNALLLLYILLVYSSF